MSADPLAIAAGLVLPDGRTWGEAATDDQLADASAVLGDSGPRRHWIGRARGYSKTSDAAAMTIAALLSGLIPAGEIGFAAAADRDQAALLREAIAGFVARTPGLAGGLVVDSWRVTARNGGAYVAVLASDAASSFGLLGRFWVVDELCQWIDSPGARRFYEALSTSWPKIPGCRVVLITTAGDPAHWSRAVYDHALGDDGWRVSDLHGPAPWMDSREIESERRRLMPSAFARYFENRWVAGEDRLTTVDDVRACVTHDGPLEPQRGCRYVCAVDIGLKRDATAVVVAHSEIRDQRSVVVVDRVDTWSGTRDRPVDLTALEAHLALLCERYRATLTFDPWQAAATTQRLKARGIPTVEFTFSSSSVGRLAIGLYNLLRDHALALPDDDSLIDELANVRLRETTPGAYRIDHDPTRHDDQVIALALAAQHLVAKGERRPMRWFSAAEITLRPNPFGTADLQPRYPRVLPTTRRT